MDTPAPGVPKRRNRRSQLIDVFTPNPAGAPVPARGKWVTEDGVAVSV